MKPRANVYKRDIHVGTWKEEAGAWLFVVIIIVILRWVYYMVEGV